MIINLGCSKMDITPEFCYSTIDGISENPIPVVDNIYVHAIIFCWNRESVLLLAYDLIGIQERDARYIRDGLKEYGVRPENIVVMATHTHTAPLTIDFLGMTVTDKSYIDLLSSASREAVQNAIDNMEPVRYGFAQFACGCNVNRLEMGRRAEVNDIDAEPGLVDDTISVLAFQRSSGEIKAVLWNYAAHPFTMWPEVVISADFPGEVAHLIENDNSGCLPFFLQGCCGNMNPRLNGGKAARDRTAQMLYTSIQRCLETIQWKEMEKLFYSSVETELSLNNGGTIKIPVQQLIGEDWSITFLPGEQFIEISIALKDTLGPNNIISAYCNKDEIGYIPTERYYSEFPYTYECDESYKYYQTPIKSVDCAEQLLSFCINNIRSITN